MRDINEVIEMDMPEVAEAEDLRRAVKFMEQAVRCMAGQRHEEKEDINKIAGKLRRKAKRLETKVAKMKENK